MEDRVYSSIALVLCKINKNYLFFLLNGASCQKERDNVYLFYKLKRFKTLQIKSQGTYIKSLGYYLKQTGNVSKLRRKKI